MHFSSIILACLGLVTFTNAQSQYGQLGHKHAWGADGQGKLVKKAATARKTSTAKSSTSTTTTSLSPTCTNGPTSRQCWSDGYNIDTDFDVDYPITGKTVTYDLEITNTTCSPDGHGDQQCMLINGQFPGPTIFADWGDTITVNVKNSLQYNGTSIHFHGIRQHNSNGADGVNGVTQCPLAPGQSYTYSFIASQYGTSWYHSHYSVQYGTGVMGMVQINGPSSANYDVDLGTFALSDWYYSGAWDIEIDAFALTQVTTPPPAGDNILVNGTGKDAAGNGSYAQVDIESGKTYLLRLINPSVDNYIYFKLDNHTFTVVSADFIPVNPIPDQDWIMFGPGQRYNVIFTADQPAANYWFRAEVATECDSSNNRYGRALFTYTGVTVAEPYDDDEAAPDTNCTELVTSPYWSQPVDSSTYASQVKFLNLDQTLSDQFSTNGQNLIVWALNYTAMNIDWSNPTLQYLFDDNTTYPAFYDVIEVPNEGTWTYWIIQSLQETLSTTELVAPKPDHPMHLHGHDFYVLGSGTGQFSGNVSELNFEDPPRRDTTNLPSKGWLVLAFQANNPGAWLMHCHIAWHISQGLGVQFLEAKDQIVMPERDAFESQCAGWDLYKSPYPKLDSGL